MTVVDPKFGSGGIYKKYLLNRNYKLGMKYILHILFYPSGGSYTPYDPVDFRRI